jgi:hypothetical protein
MSSKNFTRRIFCWLRQINRDCELPHSAKAVAIALVDYFNEDEGGVAWPGLRAIADASGIKSKATVHDLIERLEAHGHLRIERGNAGRGGHGHSNRYWMIIKSEPGDLFDDHAQRSAQAERQRSVWTERQRSDLPPASVRNSGGQRSDFAPQRSAQTEQTLLEPPKNHGGKKRERALSPSDASLGGKKGSKRPAAERSKPEAELVSAVDDAFARLWAVYPRKVEQDDARTAFAKAIKDGADSEAMIARATCYAIERATAIGNGDDPKFTVYPARWLKKKKWNDPYPEGVIRDQAGNVVAIEQEEEAEDDGDDTYPILHAYERAMGVKS